MRHALRTGIVLAVAAVVGLTGPGTATAADACPNAEFRSGAAANLPDCRAWEQISPVDKGGNDIMNTSAVAASTDGNRALFYAAGAFAGAETVTYETTYVGARGATDWLTRGADGPLVPTGMLIKATLGMSDDGTKAVVAATHALAPGAIDGGSNLYVRDLTQPHSYRLIVANESPAMYQEMTGFGGQFAYLGGNSDLSAVGFTATVPMVEGAPEGMRAAYLWHDGRLSLASRLPNGAALEASARLADTPPRDQNIVSEDGTRLTFEVNRESMNSGNRTLYQHVEGQGTSLVVRSRRAGDDASAPGEALAWEASADGRTVTFVSTEPLTDDAEFSGVRPNWLYRWTADDDQLVNLTATHTAPDAGGLGLGLLRVSPDGRYSWFFAMKPLRPGTNPGAAGLIYVVDSQTGALHVVAALDREGSMPDVRVSPNGRHIAFQSFSSVLGNDNADQACKAFGRPGDDGFCGNVYTWSVESPASAPTCLSCGPDGMHRIGAAASFGWLATTFDGRQSRAVLDDGRVFFDSADRLVPGDGNDVGDVYQYTPGRGLALLSSGVSGEPASFGDAAPDGSNVFFVTADRLVPQDRDALGDLYTARIGGGLASQHVAPRDPGGGCTGEACRPAPVPQPDRSLFGSAGFQAPVVGPSPSFRVRAPSASALRTAARTGRLLVPVTVTEPGTLRATMTGTVAGKSGRTVARATRKATRATTYRLSLRLTKAARNDLRRKGRLRVRLAVEYSEALDEHRRTVTFRANRTSTSKKGGSR